MKNRTDKTFVEHELKVTTFEGITIHEFKIPNTNDGKVVFINTHGIMSVTSNYGNFIFNREFNFLDKEGKINRGLQALGLGTQTIGYFFIAFSHTIKSFFPKSNYFR